MHACMHADGDEGDDAAGAAGGGKDAAAAWQQVEAVPTQAAVSEAREWAPRHKPVLS